MTRKLGQADRPLSETSDYIFLDLDGVCYRGSSPIENVPEGIREAEANGNKKAFLTNNSMAAPRSVAAKLASVGVDAEESEIYTSSRTAVAQVLERFPNGAKVLALGTEGLFYELEQTDLEVVTSADDKPDAVLQGLTKDLGWRELSEAALAIRQGAVYFATNLDATLPLERGQYLGCGSMVEAVVHATGVRPIASGKPAPDMYRLAMKEKGARNPICVGDRLDTDIAGANAAELPVLHVLTGVNTARDVMLAPDHERPTFLGIDMLDLNIAIPAITRDGSEWTCGEARVSLGSGVITVNGSELTTSQIGLNAYRALVATVWDAIDSGTSRDELAWLPEFTVVRENG
ncbi:HAD-IIA family hydrolase [Trueperella bialowiezensis]|uniref:Uncharacterized hydrolase yutF n=1 Tax=Trueperella bialowiezensis TaxID=312285 RepID=A0A3S4V572_9ACTO|nr:HAD-IIA family hydrolase [Trueperella bialowiezensis]VEI12329.1 Uncharacterized hydrolase yutF [Trueperella bialowiezensis]